MAENTKIEWTDHTFNPWEGCQKVGPGCDHCYAETRNPSFLYAASIVVGEFGDARPAPRGLGPARAAEVGLWIVCGVVVGWACGKGMIDRLTGRSPARFDRNPTHAYVHTITTTELTAVPAPAAAAAGGDEPRDAPDHFAGARRL